MEYMQKAQVMKEMLSPQTLLTGLEWPSELPPFRTMPLVTLLLAEPGLPFLLLPPISATSTPLSSLSVCPVSDNWHRAAAGGNRGSVSDRK